MKDQDYKRNTRLEEESLPVQREMQTPGRKTLEAYVKSSKTMSQSQEAMVNKIGGHSLQNNGRTRKDRPPAKLTGDATILRQRQDVGNSGKKLC